jgi:transcriptional regulator with GAF, ATPase, and Fis domain
MTDSGNKPVHLNPSIELENARQQANAARAETEVLRRAILTLAQNLRMDYVLDSLLRCVLHAVPCDLASVIFTEDDESGRLFVARQLPAQPAPRPVIEFEITDNPFVQRIAHMKKNIFLADTTAEPEWRATKAFADARSWIGVPLVMHDSVIGILSISSRTPGFFTAEHFRLAKLLAIPMTVSIHRAQLCEWAAIYAAERKQLLRRVGPVPGSLHQRGPLLPN